MITRTATACGITRPCGRTRARTHLGELGQLRKLDPTCGNAAAPSGKTGGTTDTPRDNCTDLRKHSNVFIKVQVTPSFPSYPTSPANNPTVKPQVSSSFPNNPTHFVSTRARAYAREA